MIRYLLITLAWLETPLISRNSGEQPVSEGISDFRLAALLAADLREANFYERQISELLTDVALKQLQQRNFVQAKLELDAAGANLGDRFFKLVILIKLFMLGNAQSVAAVDKVLPCLGVTGALRLGLIKLDYNDQLVPALGLQAVSMRGSDFWVISDLPDQLRLAAASDYVMPVGGATRNPHSCAAGSGNQGESCR